MHLDRLGRSLPHLIETLTELAKRGVGFRSLTEAIDTTTPGGRLIVHIYGALGIYEALGQFQRDLIGAGTWSRQPGAGVSQSRKQTAPRSANFSSESHELGKRTASRHPATETGALCSN